jgi:hypothetical protein
MVAPLVAPGNFKSGEVEVIGSAARELTSGSIDVSSADVSAKNRQKKGAMLSWHPFACSISVSRLPAIALSAAGTTATAATESTAAATGTLLHRFRFIDR